MIRKMAAFEIPATVINGETTKPRLQAVEFVDGGKRDQNILWGYFVSEGLLRDCFHAGMDKESNFNEYKDFNQWLAQQLEGKYDLSQVLEGLGEKLK